MTQNEFISLSAELRNLAKNIPLKWGHIQNNRNDDRINMFSIKTHSQLESAISHLPESGKNYLRRRWYLWECSRCDEYLFCQNSNVDPNPNQCDKQYDISINHQITFDIKGTVIPRLMRNDAESLIKNPAPMIDFFYDRQSTGRRYHIQNRLFIVHHSFIDPCRELYLRCAWKSKEQIYRDFCNNISSIQFYHTHGVTAGVIFILERELNKITTI